MRGGQVRPPRHAEVAPRRAAVYSVETDVEALDRIEALPARALPFSAELIAPLELAPWSRDPDNQQRPDANMRTHLFGPHSEGLATRDCCTDL